MVIARKMCSKHLVSLRVLHHSLGEEFSSPVAMERQDWNCKRSSVLLTLPLCCFHINVFTGTIFGRWGLLPGLWRAGELCSPHANGMYLSQLRASVISIHVPFISVLMLSHWLSVYPLSFLQMENSWAKVKFMPKSPALLSYQGSSCFFWHINPSADVLLIIKMCNLAAY